MGRTLPVPERAAKFAVAAEAAAAYSRAVREGVHVHAAAETSACDANGNVSDYVGTGGASVAHVEYDPFGNTLSATGPLSATFPHRFSTKYLDAETGLYYYGYRYYSPQMGRWLSRDPIEEWGGLNVCGFAKNNALLYADPLGRDVQLIRHTVEIAEDEWVRRFGGSMNENASGLRRILREKQAGYAWGPCASDRTKAQIYVNSQPVLEVEILLRKSRSGQMTKMGMSVAKHEDMHVEHDIAFLAAYERKLIELSGKCKCAAPCQALVDKYLAAYQYNLKQARRVRMAEWDMMDSGATHIDLERARGDLAESERKRDDAFRIAKDAGCL